MVRYLNTAALAGSVLICSVAKAYPTPVDFNGKLARWNIHSADDAIVYRATGEEYFVASISATIDEAAKYWSSVPDSFFRFRAAVDNEAEQVLIEFESTLDNAPFSSGYAMFDELDSELRPKHCVIHIDSNQGGLPKTILHELGHCVGLGHSIVPESIMSYRDEKNKFALDTDDVAAVSRLYPLNSGNAKLPPGCSILAGETSQNSDYIFLLLLILPTLVTVLNRNRKRAFP